MAKTKADVIAPTKQNQKLFVAKETKGACRKAVNAQIPNSAQKAPKRIPVVNNSNS